MISTLKSSFINFDKIFVNSFFVLIKTFYTSYVLYFQFNSNILYILVLATAVHIQRLEGYRYNCMCPCTRMTLVIVKHFTLLIPRCNFFQNCNLFNLGYSIFVEWLFYLGVSSSCHEFQIPSAAPAPAPFFSWVSLINWVGCFISHSQYSWSISCTRACKK